MNDQFTDIINRIWNVNWLILKYRDNLIEDVIDKEILNTVTPIIKDKNINQFNSIY